MTAHDKKSVDKMKSDMELMLSALETIQESEQVKFDEMSDKAQEGERGQRIGEIANYLGDAKDSLQAAFDALESTTAED